MRGTDEGRNEEIALKIISEVNTVISKDVALRVKIALALEAAHAKELEQLKSHEVMAVNLNARYQRELAEKDVEITKLEGMILQNMAETDCCLNKSHKKLEAEVEWLRMALKIVEDSANGIK